MDLNRLMASWGSLGLVLVSTSAIYVVVVGYTRLLGARSLATMSSFDFAATVAIGSTLATAANRGTPLIHGVASLGVLYLAQLAAAVLRRRARAGRLMDNEPLLVFSDGAMLDENLKTAHLVEREVWSAVRRAGITHVDEVEAVVLETTGTLSVLRAGPRPIDDEILRGVRR